MPQPLACSPKRSVRVRNISLSTRSQLWLLRKRASGNRQGYRRVSYFLHHFIIYGLRIGSDTDLLLTTGLRLIATTAAITVYSSQHAMGLWNVYFHQAVTQSCSCRIEIILSIFSSVLATSQTINITLYLTKAKLVIK